MHYFDRLEGVPEPRWILLIHRIPPKPAYFRVKIWRRLQGVGAIAVKSSVYVLPHSDQAREDFQWVFQEIVRRGGEAVICEARFIDGLNDDEIRQLFVTARDADYAEVVNDASQVLATFAKAPPDDLKARATVEAEVAKVRRRLAELAEDRLLRSGELATSATTMIERLEKRLKDPEPGRGSGFRIISRAIPGAHVGDAQGHPRRSDRERVAHPALHRPRGEVPLRARQDARPRAR